MPTTPNSSQSSIRTPENWFSTLWHRIFYRRPRPSPIHPIHGDLSNLAIQQVTEFENILKTQKLEGPQEDKQTSDRASSSSRQSLASAITILPAYTNRFFNPASSELNTVHINRLQQLKDDPNLRGIILFADDTISSFKILFQKINQKINKNDLNITTKIRFMHKITPKEWPEIQMTLDIFGKWAFICVANGDLAYDILALLMYHQLPIKALISDQDMPGKQGIELISGARELEAAHHLTPMPIVLNTSCTQAQLGPENLLKVNHLNATLTPSKNALEEFQCLALFGLSQQEQYSI